MYIQILGVVLYLVQSGDWFTQGSVFRPLLTFLEQTSPTSRKYKLYHLLVFIPYFSIFSPSGISFWQMVWLNFLQLYQHLLLNNPSWSESFQKATFNVLKILKSIWVYFKWSSISLFLYQCKNLIVIKKMFSWYSKFLFSPPPLSMKTLFSHQLILPYEF